MKKICAFVLVFSLILANFVPAFAATSVEEEGNFTQAFLEASDDTIVCYMEGMAIRKDQVDERGMIKPEVIQVIEARNNARATPPGYWRALPDGYTNAIVRTTLSAPRYEQRNTLYYLTEENAELFASYIRHEWIDSLTLFLVGFRPHIGPAIVLMMTFDLLYRSSVSNQVLDLTSEHCKVKVSEASSSFGTFYGVFEWTGIYFETHKDYSLDNGTTRETITNLQYK